MGADHNKQPLVMVCTLLRKWCLLFHRVAMGMGSLGWLDTGSSCVKPTCAGQSASA